MQVEQGLERVHGGVQEVQYKSKNVHMRLCGSEGGMGGCDDEEELLLGHLTMGNTRETWKVLWQVWMM